MRALFQGTFVLLCSLLLTACASEMQLAARDRFESSFRCPRERIRMQSLGSGAYRVGGCGHEATYICESAEGVAAMDDPAICRLEHQDR
jgi:hypothetical protein